MTLQEVAAELARRLDAELQPQENPDERLIQGKGYQIVVAPFFGGWQATLLIPGDKPLPFFCENVDMLEVRIKARLTGKEYRF